MAAEFYLYNASYIVDLSDSSIHGLREGSTLGQPAIKRVFSDVWKRGYNTLGGISYDNREVILMIRIKGTSLDNWITNSRQIKQLLFDLERYWETDGLDGGRGYLSIKLNGMTNAVEFDVLAGQLEDEAVFKYSMTLNTSAPILIDVPLRLIVKPFARPQNRTITTSGTLTNGAAAGYTLSAPSGDLSLASPLRLTFQGAASDTPARILTGRKTYAPNFQHMLEAETTTGTYYNAALTNPGTGTMAVAAVGAASGGNVARLTGGTGGQTSSGVILTWTIKTPYVQDFFGTYRVFLRIDAQSGTWTSATVQLKYGGSAGTTISRTAQAYTSSGSDYLIELGRMTIPHAQQPINAAPSNFIFTVTVSAVASSSNPTLDFDCIYLLPIDEEALDYCANAAFTSQDQLISDSLLTQPMLYMLDSTGKLTYPTFTVNMDSRFSVLCGRATRWFTIMLRTGVGSYPSFMTHDLTDQYTLSFDYYSLYGMFR